MARNSITLPPWIVPTLPGAVDTPGIWVVDTSGPTTVAFGSGNFIHNSKFSVEIDGVLTAIAGNSLADLSLDGIARSIHFPTNGALHGQEIDARHTQFEGGGAGLESIDANLRWRTRSPTPPTIHPSASFASTTATSSSPKAAAASSAA